jgi:hypothetical protein
MSLPATLSGPALSVAAIPINPLDSVLQIFNTNPYFIGIMMLVLNIGGRFISLEVTKKQEQFLQLPWVRRILIFTVLFVATRNIWVAFWTTVAVVLFLGYLFNENSALCIFGRGGGEGSKCAEAPKPGEEMTPEEREILQRLSSKAQRYQSTQAKSGAIDKNPQQQALNASISPPTDDDDVPHTDVYAANLSLLRNFGGSA